METNEELHSIDTRLAVVEAELRSIANLKKMIFGVMVFLIAQGVGGVVGFTEMRSEFRNLDLGAYETNVATALTVLGQHGEELAAVRHEDSEVRGALTELFREHSSLKDTIDKKTEQRFYKSDGDRLDGRITRLEDYIFDGVLSGASD